jgi:NADH-quinone oxidoreductase subunit F
MDIRFRDAAPSDEEREAIDALLGPPAGAWDGGARGSHADYHSAVGGRAMRERRHLLVPALQALQRRTGWISEGGMDYVCRRLGVPPADAWGVATFYALLATSPRPRRVLHVCEDLACRAHGAGTLCEALEREMGPALPHAPSGEHVEYDAERPAWMRSPCLGMCDHAPAAMVTEAGVAPVERLYGEVSAGLAVEILASGSGFGVPGSEGAAATLARVGIRNPEPGTPNPSWITSRIPTVDPTSLAAYRDAGGYQALAHAIALGPAQVIAQLDASKLVGRGGAAFPTGRKWDAVRAIVADQKYIVCNADESEPGTFKDRVLLTGDPFAVVEAMTIAGITAGATRGFVYLRAEYPLAFERLTNAVKQAREARLLGPDVMGSGCAFDIELRRGAGAYICGEETALFESIEGYRGEPRSKPPFPVHVGLFGRPTVVNNVETLCTVLPIVLHGGEAFARVGTSHSTGTRLFCLSGAVARPGVYEAPMGITLGELLEHAGRPARLRAVLLGGAAGTFVRADELDLRLTIEDARAAGTTLGSGVVMAFDDQDDLTDAVLRIAAFFRDESCGQCVPCRVGTVRQEEVLHRLVRGHEIGDATRELALLDDVGVAMRDASICGLGQTAYAAVESAVKRLGLFDGRARATVSP